MAPLTVLQLKTRFGGFPVDPLGGDSLVNPPGVPPVVGVGEGVKVGPGMVWVAVGTKVAVGGMGVCVGAVADTEKLHQAPLSAKTDPFDLTATTCQ